jgi:hypothetical protein
MIATYQPLHYCKDPSFRVMCFSLNKKKGSNIQQRQATNFIERRIYHYQEEVEDDING